MASLTGLDEEDDFGGDFPGSNDGRQAGSKRSFGDLVEEEEEEEDVFGQKKKSEESGPGATTGMILSLRESLHDCKDKLAACQADLEAEKAEVQKWYSAFQNEAAVPAGINPEPGMVVNYLRGLKSSDESLKEQLDKAKKREAALIVTFAKKEQDTADLKSALRDARAQLKPSSVQARRLLLDPAIHEEFTRLKNLNEEKDKKLKELEENAEAVTFTPQSIMGKTLMSKCRTLLEENNEIGAIASEGKIHELSMKLALQKSQNVEIRSQFEALYKQMEGLTQDVERSREMVFVLQEKLDERNCEIRKLKESSSYEELETHVSDSPDVKTDNKVICEDIQTEPV